MALRRLSATVAITAAAVVSMAGCSSDTETEETTTAGAEAAAVEEAPSEAAAFPRTITHELGETVIEEQPQNIVSTAITVTGSLLAIDAPVTATAATTVSPGLTDDNGFFAQWSDVATEQGVEVLYPNLEFDIEAVIAAEPDLIVASTTGADAAADYYDELSAIAPTVVIDYSDKTWQEVAEIAGEWTGLEDNATAVVEDFDAAVADAAASITLPEGTSQAVVYNGLETQAAVGKLTGAHATLLSALGFDVIEADESLDISEEAREDFTFVAPENISAGVTADSVFLVNGTDDTKADFESAEVLSSLPSVTSGQVYPLGETSFRIDYYSALQIVDTVKGYFGA
ncbi:Fe2+-enterobactin ABC transporter substrate-binding protein [Demequina sp. NBRC 110057]|uniref:Fe2+-enterobactin ABC transporter substrate-binding protein n=1 Tax=Demequina sp. NBRC 110057 TaxID=1570346 RepID=UPI000A0521E7|nr:Fe2+-enterobactin ABC transporter substrate-binding protein [Demequina sp. NBRC 110057]